MGTVSLILEAQQKAQGTAFPPGRSVYYMTGRREPASDSGPGWAYDRDDDLRAPNPTDVS